ncbi:hypothetical protein Q2941_43960 [Bradyrhizobium sp. UFLA05-153]
MPGFIKPQLATLKSKAPKGEQWLHEIKYDGYRVQVHLNRGRKRAISRPLRASSQLRLRLWLRPKRETSPCRFRNSSARRHNLSLYGQWMGFS